MYKKIRKILFILIVIFIAMNIVGNIAFASSTTVVNTINAGNQLYLY